jgi:tetratricopeptide (TPR) repeat protein
MSRIAMFAMAFALALASLSAGAALADQRDARLDDLFQQLQAAEAGDAQRLERSIWEIWSRSDSRLVNELMNEGVHALAERRLGRALQRFDQIVRYQPEFAEGWNKRATVHFLMRNYEASVRDIQQTLDLEPRHFGALAGLGLIYDSLNQPEAAIRSFEAALEIHPHLDGLRRRIEELQETVGGRRT